VLLGTTEEQHDLTKPIVCSDAETRYLLAILNRYLRDPIDTSAIESTFSGVRPIVRKRKDTLGDMSAASRDSEIEVYDRLVNVFGGKWTSARHLGNEVAKLL
jgi:glycerol-3-phosphate dehydrogenase